MDADTDADTAAFAQHIVGICRHLGHEVVAEGVETESIRSFLLDQSVETYQGYLFARPMPADRFIDRFERHMDAREGGRAEPRRRAARA